ncbi:protein SOSEKI 5 [Beta vulgaris subsp. vulgaris]|uniref:protein SOSEKI 5 n=1 Tax=Beta vulgaris subsp. vulgaris TaxID=3555 RepID=UPI0020368DBF|nr:protein SOSEKI 5 [Beta vulgaris subsp. vulgaris]
MAVTLSRGRNEQLHLQKFKEKDDHKQNHHHHHFIDQNQKKSTVVVVPVVYYLSRNGQLEHPHFMEVPLSSSHGLFLRDVINRLNLLRGKSMASHYSWSSKRSYKSGYVWNDLEENDFIQPVHGGEYVLKGSEIQVETISPSTVSKLSETTSSSSSTGKNTLEASRVSDFSPAVRIRRRNQSWGAIDLHEYKVYKTESTHEFAGKAAADASTQTNDKRSRIRKAMLIKEVDEHEEQQRERRGDKILQAEQQHQHSSAGAFASTTTELSREEISPPPSDSSPETLESLMKADGRLLIHASSSSTSSSQAVNNQCDLNNNNQMVGSCPSGRMKASTVLMSLISCGSLSFKDCGPTAVKDHGFSLISHYKTRVPRGGNQTVEGNHGDMMMMMEIENHVSSSFAKMAIEDKEYFSGSLIETKKQEFPTMLKKSSSYNADRSSHLKLEEKEVEGVRAKCIPRKLRTQTSTNKKECDAEISRASEDNSKEGN